MKKQKKRIKAVSPVVTVVLFALAVVMLLGGSIGGTRAALTYYSENYEMHIEVPSIGVSLVENDAVVCSRNYVGNEWKESKGELLEQMLPGEDEKLVPGKKYVEALKVRNSGTIDSYVRVILYKNWTKDGEKADTELSPDLIELNLTGNGWIVDEDASTAERTEA